MPGRKFDAGSGYRYGFNGKEDDNSTGEGNVDFGNRLYDTRIGRWFSLDRKENIGWSGYNFVVNNPIRYKDLDGDIQVDPKGNIIFTPISKSASLRVPGASNIFSKFLTNGQKYIHAQVIQGYIWTNDGHPILVYKIVSVTTESQESDGEGGSKRIYNDHAINDPQVSFYQTNCFGRSIANGEFFIPELEEARGGFRTALNHDYKKINLKNSSFIKGDVVDIGILNTVTGEYEYGSHIVKASGTYNDKGQMLFESQYAYDENGIKLLTLEETASYGNENIIDQEESGKFSSKHIKVYRKKERDKIMYPVMQTPQKSLQGAKKEKEITNDKDVQNETPKPTNL